METFSALLALCGGNSPATDEFPAQRPVTRSYDVFFDLRLNKRLSKQSRRRWFETPSRPLRCHCNVQRRQMSTKTSLFTCVLTVRSAVCSAWQHSKHQSSSSLVICEGNPQVTRGLTQCPVMRKVSWRHRGIHCRYGRMCRVEHGISHYCDIIHI